MPEQPTLTVGQWSDTFRGRIDPDGALAYARATNDPNPVYEERGGVPPLASVPLIFQSYLDSQRGAMAPGAIEGVRGGVHGEHDLWLHRPLRAGADLSWQVETSCVAQTRAGVLVAQHIVVSDDEGPAVEHFWTTLLMGGTIPGDLGTPLVDHTFPEAAREHALGSHAFPVERDQAYRYGGASGDRAAMHLDDKAAERAGFPSKFMQGMCSFAMCSGAVVKFAAGGDPDRLRRLACRFSAPTFPGHDLVVTVYDAGIDADGAHQFAFEAESNGATTIKHGRAVVAD